MVLSLILMLVLRFAVLIINLKQYHAARPLQKSKQGRIISLYVLALMGTAPFGSLLAGISANHIRAPQYHHSGMELFVCSPPCFLSQTARDPGTDSAHIQTAGADRENALRAK